MWHSSGSISHRAVVIACLLFSGNAFPWGQQGHKLVGEIASNYLTPEASQQVSAILQGDLGANGKPSGRTTLGEVASWPDEIRGKPAAQGKDGWHFEDIPVCGNASPDQICPQGNCASAQLARLSEVLRNPQAAARDRNEALKWVVHLMGDIHQPLHAADNKDHGGNTVKVSFLGKRTGTDGRPLNLHKIWDVQIVERVVADRGGEAAFLGRTTTPEEVNAWAGGSVLDWMQESNALARDVVYAKLPTGFSCGTQPTATEAIDRNYYAEAGPVVELQLWKAGVRLASLLNAAFGGMPEVAPSAGTATTEPTTTEIPTAGPPLLPDPAKTPGKASYLDESAVCSMGSTKNIRNVPAQAKQRVYASYGVAVCQGYCSGPQGCEIDHLISLELGGANTEDNLWPQPYDGDWNAHDKDRLENLFRKMVCVDKTISLQEAQQEISTDWISAYKKYIGALHPFNGVAHCK